MSSSRLKSNSTINESDSSLIKTVKRIVADYAHRDLSSEKITVLAEKIYQIWINAGSFQLISDQGYRLIDYLEQLIREQTVPDHFLILISSVLAKNPTFFHALLIDHQRFQVLFNASMAKPIYLMRFEFIVRRLFFATVFTFSYIELLYYYCPSSLVNTVGLQFYRFALDTYLLPYLRRKPRDIDWLAACSTLLHQFHENSIESIFLHEKDALDFCKTMIDTFLHHSLKIKDLVYDLKLINTIMKVLPILWKNESSSLELQSIEYLFTSMFHPSSSSPTILAVFTRIHLDAAEITVKTMFNDGRMTGEGLSVMIKSLIEMIDAPIQLMQSMPYETWITGLCTALISFHQQEDLIQLIDQTTAFLTDHLFYEQTSENALQILFWFVRYDKRVEPFLTILKRFPTLFERFANSSNDEFSSKLIELCHMAITLHPEADLSNEPRLKEILRRYPPPDFNVLSNHRYLHTRLHSTVSDSTKHRVGIVNLGNTCYVNSVLQALYQCDLFRQYILEHQFDGQPVLRELQILFAQLNLSKRPFINAMNVVKVARPSWFQNNEQQDCAEFLGYLLDTIKDEEKKEKNLSIYQTERLFTIRTSQINRCQRCSKESSREELSNYLFLPIPTMPSNTNQSAMSIIDQGLKFYPASNRNSHAEEHVKAIAASLITKSSTTSIRSQSPSPPSYTTMDQEKNIFSLQKVFDCYFQKEDLKDENQYRCEFCRSLQDAERYIILQTAPEYLILSLNRFEYEKQTNIFRKVFTKLTYPKILNVHLQTLTKYCLVLVIVHTGYTLHGGHYYVYAREIKPLLSAMTLDDPEDYFTDDEWFLFNDDQVSSSSYQALIDHCTHYPSATPYILFYRRIDRERLEAMKDSTHIRIHPSLTNQIEEENQTYQQEQEKFG